MNQRDRDFNDIYAQAIEALYDELNPEVLLMPNTVNGLDYAPAVANGLSVPLVTDAIDTARDDTIDVMREMYDSKVETVVEVDAEQVALTIRPGKWPPTEETGDADIREFEADIDGLAVRSTLTDFQEIGGDVDITEAEVLVSVGRGIEDEENITLVQELADTFGATLSSSRPIVDNDRLPKNRQVGQSGKVVTPAIYIAIGISGAVQHVAG